MDEDAPEYIRREPEALNAFIQEKTSPYGRVIRSWKMAIFWSVLFSVTIIGEGYDLALMGNFFSLRQFQDLFGRSHGPGLPREIPALWQSGMLCAALAGQLIGIYFTGHSVDRYGHRKTVIFALGQVMLPTRLSHVWTTISSRSESPLWCNGYGQSPSPSVPSSLPSPPGGSFVRAAPRTPESLSDGSTSRPDFPLEGHIRAMELTNEHERDSLHSPATASRTSSIASKSKNEPTVRCVPAVSAEAAAARGSPDAVPSYADCFHGTNRRRTEIVVMLNLTQQLCGSCLMFYSAKLYQKGGIAVEQAYDYTLVQYGLGLVAIACSWALMQRLMRPSHSVRVVHSSR
ncbi:maltose permease [Verticillium alfalfae VaMs.102]|uniref:Maltose permease n=1 Tax=Verticillium alfalfae (strain VaMs.102 / ATCC MYA-4576 / FGSC 10136) TaxID=526221 RepID=C9SPN2_VERA1|nr:maltose permease [Verticillium alfalfae VaMs.102]EEY20747.1 maltose permease [Verticillium alfalfae VaMs.102]